MARTVTPKMDRRITLSIKPSTDAKETVELEYRVLIPGNFSRSEPGSHKDGDGSLKSRRVRVIGNKSDFKNTLKDINPRLKLVVPNKISDDPEAKLEVNLDIKDMKDIHPDEIAMKVKPIQELMEARERLKKFKHMIFKDPKLAKEIGKIGIKSLSEKLDLSGDAK